MGLLIGEGTGLGNGDRSLPEAAFGGDKVGSGGIYSGLCKV